MDNPEAGEIFRKVGFIYSILSDPNKRSHYDRFGANDLDEVDSGSESEAEVANGEEADEIDEELAKVATEKLKQKYKNIDRLLFLLLNIQHIRY